MAGQLALDETVESCSDRTHGFTMCFIGGIVRTPRCAHECFEHRELWVPEMLAFMFRHRQPRFALPPQRYRQLSDLLGLEEEETITTGVLDEKPIATLRATIDAVQLGLPLMSKGDTIPSYYPNTLIVRVPPGSSNPPEALQLTYRGTTTHCVTWNQGKPSNSAEEEAADHICGWLKSFANLHRVKFQTYGIHSSDSESESDSDSDDSGIAADRGSEDEEEEDSDDYQPSRYEVMQMMQQREKRERIQRDREEQLGGWRPPPDREKWMDTRLLSCATVTFHWSTTLVCASIDRAHFDRHAPATTITTNALMRYFFYMPHFFKDKDLVMVDPNDSSSGRQSYYTLDEKAPLTIVVCITERDKETSHPIIALQTKNRTQGIYKGWIMRERPGYRTNLFKHIDRFPSLPPNSAVTIDAFNTDSWSYRQFSGRVAQFLERLVGERVAKKTRSEDMAIRFSGVTRAVPVNDFDDRHDIDYIDSEVGEMQNKLAGEILDNEFYKNRLTIQMYGGGLRARMPS